MANTRKAQLIKNSTQPATAGGQVQSLTRALNLLERLSKAEMGMNLTELAGSLGLAPSTAHRLLNSMRQLEYVEYDEDQGLWSIGVKTFSVGNAYLKKRDFIAQARPFMKQLVTETNETANIAILKDDQIIFVGQVECTQMMRMVVQLGNRAPSHASGVGKALLSSLPRKEVMALIQRNGLHAFTDNTISSPSQFEAELQLIQRQGYALDDEEQYEGLRCVAANIYDEYGEAVAAVSISGPSVRVKRERIPMLSATVMETADKITRAIGGVKPKMAE